MAKWPTKVTYLIRPQTGSAVPLNWRGQAEFDFIQSKDWCCEGGGSVLGWYPVTSAKLVHWLGDSGSCIDLGETDRLATDLGGGSWWYSSPGSTCFYCKSKRNGKIRAKFRRQRERQKTKSGEWQALGWTVSKDMWRKRFRSREELACSAESVKSDVCGHYVFFVVRRKPFMAERVGFLITGVGRTDQKLEVDVKVLRAVVESRGWRRKVALTYPGLSGDIFPNLCAWLKEKERCVKNKSVRCSVFYTGTDGAATSRFLWPSDRKRKGKIMKPSTWTRKKRQYFCFVTPSSA